MALVVGLLKVRAVVILPVLAAAAVGLYYWFVAPAVAETLGIAPVGAVVIQGAALALVAVWLWRAMRRVHSSNGSSKIQRAQPVAERWVFWRYSIWVKRIKSTSVRIKQNQITY